MRWLTNNRILIALLGGVLLSLAWWEHSTGLIILVAFTPFIWILKRSKEEQRAGSYVFGIILSGLLVFNILTFSWLGKASVAGATMAILAHSLMSSTVFWIVYKISHKSGTITSALSLISFWLGYEYFCLNIDIISPWLNMGNVFGKEPQFIQWYEYTGVSGGSLWILTVNILLFYSVVDLNRSRRISIKSIVTILVILLPILLSYNLFNNYVEKSGTSSIIIVQPNVDPYSEKFDSIPFIDQLNNMFQLAGNEVNNSVDWVVLPETSVDDPFYESTGKSNRYVQKGFDFVNRYEGANIIMGATTARVYFDSISRSKSHSQIDESLASYELFNSALHIGTGGSLEFYHKSKLVPGIEKSVSILPPFLEKIIVTNIGGTMTGYGTQPNRDNFTHTLTGTIIAPLICYESAYGEFTTEYIRKGAEIIFIITNDGWWDNTAGYKQHLWHASIRSIENRRSVVRSANTGISCFIDQRGAIVAATNWWEEDVLSGVVAPNNEITFYTMHGDLLYKYFTFSAVILFILAFVAAPIRRLGSRTKNL